MRTLVLASVLLSFTAIAGEELTPDKMAKIKFERKAAADAVDKKYGNKKPADLSPAERKAMTQEKNEAQLKVLDKNGVDSKTFSRADATMNKEDRAATEGAEKAMEKKAADDKAADDKKKAAAKDGKKEIVVEKGGKGGPPGPGGPPQDDAAEAAAMDKEMGLGKGKK